MAARRKKGAGALVERVAGSLHVALGGDPAAPPVVLVHGLGATWRVWKPLLADLTEHFHVIALDLPGFGRSAGLEEGEDQYSLSIVGLRIDEALADLGIERCAVVGHSLGGGIAASYAIEHGDRVGALALLAPAGFFRYPGIVRAAWDIDLFHHVGRHGTRYAGPVVVSSELLRRAVFRQLFHDPSVVTREELEELVGESLLGNARRTAGAAILDAHLIERSDALTMPTLLAWGRGDRIVRARYAEELAAAIPGCERLLLLERAGHMLMWDRLDVLGPELRAFISACATQGAFEPVSKRRRRAAAPAPAAKGARRSAQ